MIITGTQAVEIKISKETERAIARKAMETYGKKLFPEYKSSYDWEEWESLDDLYIKEDGTIWFAYEIVTSHRSISRACLLEKPTTTQVEFLALYKHMKELELI